MTVDVPELPEIDFELRGDHIALDSLLKATGLAHSGGEAKAVVAAGRVRVDGLVETRKTFKVCAGHIVELDERRIRILPQPQPQPSADGAEPAAPG